MTASDQNKNDPLSRKHVRQALRNWYNLAKLGEHPLARLQVVEHARINHQRATTSIGYGLSLREVLQLALNQLKVEKSEPDYQDKRWHPYIILKEELIEGRSAHYLSVQLNDMALRTYQLTQAKAIDKLASILHELEDEEEQKLAMRIAREPRAGLSIEQRIVGLTIEEERALLELLLKKLEPMK